MDSSTTLQDFVLNLIYDPAARSAFELDPHGTLQDAGLGDVTSADVQDVLPLVLDYAPVAGVTGIEGLAAVDDLTTGVANLDVAGAVAHLQTITAQAGAAGSHLTGDLNVAAAGTVTVTADHLVSGVVGGGAGLYGSAVYGPGLFGDGLFGQAGAHVVPDHGVLGGLDAGHDPAAGLDAVVTAPVEHGVTGVNAGAHTAVDTTVDSAVGHVAPTIAGSLDAGVNTVTGLTGSTGIDSSHLDVPGVHEATSSVIGSVLGSDPAGAVLPDPAGTDSTIAHIEHHVSGVTDAVGGLTHAAEPDADHDVLGGLGLHF
jgi:hypothetical protein